MKEKSTIFMTLGSTFGMAIAFILTILIFAIARDYMVYIPFLFIGLALIFRCIGYGLDRIVDRKK